MPVSQAVIDWPTTAAMVAVVAPLVALPLTVVMFHLKALREHQVSRREELARRIDTVDQSLGSARRTLVEIQRDYTTKEEWLRESMASRHHFERMLAAVTRLETEISVVRGWSQYIESRLRAAGASERPGPTDEAATQANRAEQS